VCSLSFVCTEIIWNNINWAEVVLHLVHRCELSHVRGVGKQTIRSQHVGLLLPCVENDIGFLII